MSKNCLNLKSEDTVQCSFFSCNHLSSNQWDQLCDDINSTIGHLTKDYIWHRDKFSVHIPILDNNKSDIPHLVSITCFGDNIEDEWFIVYIVIEITKIFKDLIVQLEDNDGDFILIEAADFLPSWTNPDTTENRVFIYNQEIHIIPPQLAATDSPLNIVDAINVVAQNPNITKASEEIHNAIVKRVGGYPEKMYNNFHNAVLKLPVEIAAVLHLEPSLISPIVNTYCNLDTLEARQMINFKKDVKFDDCINVKVKFTKYLYAMMLHSPLLNSIKYRVLESDKEGQSGLKITSGYKIITGSKDPFSSTGYKNFLKSLTKNGYFKENLEGSNQYTDLLEKAKNYFLNIESLVTSHVANIIDNLKSTDEFENIKKVLKGESDSGLLKDDDDKWLTIHPDELNTLLKDQYGKKENVKSDTVTPHLITSELSSFLQKTSDFEGIEQEGDNDDIEDGEIEFDSEEFVSCLERMLNLVTNNEEPDNDSSEDMSDDDFSDSENTAQDLELATKLKTINGENSKDDKNIVNNFVQSMKEEVHYGPSSTIMKSIGINKSDILDSDDDEL